MPRSARGLPEGFSLDLPDEKPTVIGDFLDEEPQALPVRRAPKRQVETENGQIDSELRVAVTKEPVAVQRPVPAPIPVQKQQPSVIRYQLNCTPKSKDMLEELVKHVRKYSPQSDARTSEVFQGMMALLHSAMNELELSDLPKRGAWGSVTAKNFPGALSDAFEKAIINGARRRGRV